MVDIDFRYDTPAVSPFSSQEELDKLGVCFRKPTVYIVDDESAVLELLDDYLEGQGYDISSFSKGVDALYRIERDRPEVVLVDLNMPDIHGLELIQLARRTSPDTSFIVITGYTTVDTVMTSLRSGVNDYLTKPFSSPESVRMVVRNTVEKQRLEAVSRLHATVTSTILKLGEVSCVGETREEFFNLVGSVLKKVLSGTAVCVVYQGPQRLLCHIQTANPLSAQAREHLQATALSAFGTGGAADTVELKMKLLNPELTAPLVDQLNSTLPLPILGLSGIEAQVVVAHSSREAFDREEVKVALSLTRNVNLIVQRHFLGATHEHQMIVDLLHHLRDGVVVIDREYDVRYVNPQARKILGLAPEASLQDALTALSRIDKSLVASRSPRSFLAALQKQVTVNLDGVELFFDVQAYTFYTPTKVAYRMILFRDVTHLRRERARIERLNQRLSVLNQELTERNARLETMNKELDSFAYIASHDLQEPFRHIEIFVQYLEQELLQQGQLPGESNYLLGQIGKNVEIAKRLLGDLRTLSRVTRMRNPHVKVKLTELLEEVLERFGDQIEERQVKITVTDLPEFRCDAVKMKEVFHNLISNSLKYNDKDVPEIDIGAARLEDSHLIWLGDNGIGIEEEYHEYVFQACRRIPYKDEVDGSGLGLAIVKKVVEEHGGTIWVESELGQGAKFLMRLPIIIG
jgi:signal transduction histidine kinase/FixJ family two-component response regulator